MSVLARKIAQQLLPFERGDRVVLVGKCPARPDAFEQRFLGFGLTLEVGAIGTIDRSCIVEPGSWFCKFDGRPHLIVGELLDHAE